MADYFHKEIWTSLGDLGKLDLNHDGTIDKHEVEVTECLELELGVALTNVRLELGLGSGSE